MNLIKADLLRIARDLPLRIVAALLLAFDVISVALFKFIEFMAEQVPEAGDALGQIGMQSLSNTAFASCLALGNVGILLIVGAAMFVGKDFSYATIRDKLTTGNSRVKVYLSTLASALIYALPLHVLSMLVTAGATAAFFQTASIDFVLCGLASLPLYIGFLSVAVMITMLMRNATLGLVANIVVAFLLPALLALLDMADSETLRNVLSVIPYQTINALSVGAASVSLGIKALVSGLALAVLSTAAGCIVFRRLELK